MSETRPPSDDDAAAGRSTTAAGGYDDPGDPRGFEPDVLDSSVIAVPLLRRFIEEDERPPGTPPEVHPVMIDVNLAHVAGSRAARTATRELVREMLETRDDGGGGSDRERIEPEDLDGGRYVFADLTAATIQRVVAADRSRSEDEPARRLIHKVWPDFPVKPLITRSISTIKADAAQVSFSALGDGIVWAVVDSGIQGDHRHFRQHANLVFDEGSIVEHRDLTAEDGEGEPLTDAFGHGTHVAGIIAGAAEPDPDDADGLAAVWRFKDEAGAVQYRREPLRRVSGVAPRTKIVSLKVLGNDGDGRARHLVKALQYVHRVNDYGRHLRIHGVNLSVGYDFEPEWFACGQSPLCVEVDRLVMSGVVVVCAAGNTGYGWTSTLARGNVTAGLDLTINDPGNAEQAITVGSTHRDMPHIYGVSYFSSKGPTGDGRQKPDLLAPGEKILSAAAGARREDAEGKSGGPVDYVEDSGTSMAAPHVSGAIAAFLSIRGEFKGRAQQVKRIFLDSATDLGRDPRFQGQGLVDLMRAIQSV